MNLPASSLHFSQAVSELAAPVTWHTIDFVADLHLQTDDATWQAFAYYLQHTPAQAIFLLGDILELWAGDDALQHPSQAFPRQLVQALHAASQHKALYFMHGNRDFLVGADFCVAAGMTLLADPCVLQLPPVTRATTDSTGNQGAFSGGSNGEPTKEAGLRILLSHGDALCIDDVAYMQFRQQVRNPAWQQTLLQQPLEQRLALAQQLRQQSSQRKNELGVEGYADVDATLAVQWLQTHGCTLLVHGHTHKPQDHDLPGTTNNSQTLRRMVLSDWDLLVSKPRAEALRLQCQPDGAWRWSRRNCCH
ncbi:MAG: metallophosphoesterase [Brachymonas sp.]|nr:metallophosphoesterase [Brachymonas sp.]